LWLDESTVQPKRAENCWDFRTFNSKAQNVAALAQQVT